MLSMSCEEKVIYDNRLDRRIENLILFEIYWIVFSIEYALLRERNNFKLSIVFLLDQH